MPTHVESHAVSQQYESKPHTQLSRLGEAQPGKVLDAQHRPPPDPPAPDEAELLVVELPPHPAPQLVSAVPTHASSHAVVQQ